MLTRVQLQQQQQQQQLQSIRSSQTMPQLVSYTRADIQEQYPSNFASSNSQVRKSNQFSDELKDNEPGRRHRKPEKRSKSSSRLDGNSTSLRQYEDDQDGDDNDDDDQDDDAENSSDWNQQQHNQQGNNSTPNRQSRPPSTNKRRAKRKRSQSASRLFSSCFHIPQQLAHSIKLPATTGQHQTSAKRSILSHFRLGGGVSSRASSNLPQQQLQQPRRPVISSSQTADNLHHFGGATNDSPCSSGSQMNRKQVSFGQQQASTSHNVISTPTTSRNNEVGPINTRIDQFAADQESKLQPNEPPAGQRTRLSNLPSPIYLVDQSNPKAQQQQQQPINIVDNQQAQSIAPSNQLNGRPFVARQQPQQQPPPPPTLYKRIQIAPMRTQATQTDITAYHLMTTTQTSSTTNTTTSNAATPTCSSPANSSQALVRGRGAGQQPAGVAGNQAPPRSLQKEKTNSSAGQQIDANDRPRQQQLPIQLTDGDNCELRNRVAMEQRQHQQDRRPTTTTKSGKQREPSSRPDIMEETLSAQSQESPNWPHSTGTAAARQQQSLEISNSSVQLRVASAEQMELGGQEEDGDEDEIDNLNGHSSLLALSSSSNSSSSTSLVGHDSALADTLQCDLRIATSNSAGPLSLSQVGRSSLDNNNVAAAAVDGEENNQQRRQDERAGETATTTTAAAQMSNLNSKQTNSATSIMVGVANVDRRGRDSCSREQAPTVVANATAASGESKRRKRLKQTEPKEEEQRQLQGREKRDTRRELKNDNHETTPPSSDNNNIEPPGEFKDTANVGGSNNNNNNNNAPAELQKDQHLPSSFAPPPAAKANSGPSPSSGGSGGGEAFQLDCSDNRVAAVGGPLDERRRRERQQPAPQVPTTSDRRKPISDEIEANGRSGNESLQSASMSGRMNMELATGGALRDQQRHKPVTSGDSDDLSWAVADKVGVTEARAAADDNDDDDGELPPKEIGSSGVRGQRRHQCEPPSSPPSLSEASSQTDASLASSRMLDQIGRKLSKICDSKEPQLQLQRQQQQQAAAEHNVDLEMNDSDDATIVDDDDEAEAGRGDEAELRRQSNARQLSDSSNKLPAEQQAAKTNTQPQQARRSSAAPIIFAGNSKQQLDGSAPGADGNQVAGQQRRKSVDSKQPRPPTVDGASEQRQAAQLADLNAAAAERPPIQPNKKNLDNQQEEEATAVAEDQQTVASRDQEAREGPSLPGSVDDVTDRGEWAGLDNSESPLGEHERRENVETNQGNSFDETNMATDGGGKFAPATSTSSLVAEQRRDDFLTLDNIEYEMIQTCLAMETKEPKRVEFEEEEEAAGLDGARSILRGESAQEEVAGRRQEACTRSGGTSTLSTRHHSYCSNDDFLILQPVAFKHDEQQQLCFARRVDDDDDLEPSRQASGGPELAGGQDDQLGKGQNNESSFATSTETESTSSVASVIPSNNSDFCSSPPNRIEPDEEQSSAGLDRVARSAPSASLSNQNNLNDQPSGQSTATFRDDAHEQTTPTQLETTQRAEGEDDGANRRLPLGRTGQQGNGMAAEAAAGGDNSETGQNKLTTSQRATSGESNSANSSPLSNGAEEPPLVATTTTTRAQSNDQGAETLPGNGGSLEDDHEQEDKNCTQSTSRCERAISEQLQDEPRVAIEPKSSGSPPAESPPHSCGATESSADLEEPSERDETAATKLSERNLASQATIRSRSPSPPTTVSELDQDEDLSVPSFVDNCRRQEEQLRQLAETVAGQVLDECLACGPAAEIERSESDERSASPSSSSSSASSSIATATATTTTTSVSYANNSYVCPADAAATRGSQSKTIKQSDWRDKSGEQINSLDGERDEAQGGNRKGLPERRRASESGQGANESRATETSKPPPLSRPKLPDKPAHLRHIQASVSTNKLAADLADKKAQEKSVKTSTPTDVGDTGAPEARAAIRRRSEDNATTTTADSTTTAWQEAVGERPSEDQDHKSRYSWSSLPPESSRSCCQQERAAAATVAVTATSIAAAAAAAARTTLAGGRAHPQRTEAARCSPPASSLISRDELKQQTAMEDGGCLAPSECKPERHKDPEQQRASVSFEDQPQPQQHHKSSSSSSTCSSNQRANQQKRSPPSESQSTNTESGGNLRQLDSNDENSSASNNNITDSQSERNKSNADEPQMVSDDEELADDETLTATGRLPSPVELSTVSETSEGSHLTNPADQFNAQPRQQVDQQPAACNRSSAAEQQQPASRTRTPTQPNNQDLANLTEQDLAHSECTLASETGVLTIESDTELDQDVNLDQYGDNLKQQQQQQPQPQGRPSGGARVQHASVVPKAIRQPTSGNQMCSSPTTVDCPYVHDIQPLSPSTLNLGQAQPDSFGQSASSMHKQRLSHDDTMEAIEDDVEGEEQELRMAAAASSSETSLDRKSADLLPPAAFRSTSGEQQNTGGDYSHGYEQFGGRDRSSLCNTPLGSSIKEEDEEADEDEDGDDDEESSISVSQKHGFVVVSNNNKPKADRNGRKQQDGPSPPPSSSPSSSTCSPTNGNNRSLASSSSSSTTTSTSATNKTEPSEHTNGSESLNEPLLQQQQQLDNNSTPTRVEQPTVENNENQDLQIPSEATPTRSSQQKLHQMQQISSNQSTESGTNAILEHLSLHHTEPILVEPPSLPPPQVSGTTTNQRQQMLEAEEEPSLELEKSRSIANIKRQSWRRESQNSAPNNNKIDDDDGRADLQANADAPPAGETQGDGDEEAGNEPETSSLESQSLLSSSRTGTMKRRRKLDDADKHPSKAPADQRTVGSSDELESAQQLPIPEPAEQPTPTVVDGDEENQAQQQPLAGSSSSSTSTSQTRRGPPLSQLKQQPEMTTTNQQGKSQAQSTGDRNQHQQLQHQTTSQSMDRTDNSICSSCSCLESFDQQQQQPPPQPQKSSSKSKSSSAWMSQEEGTVFTENYWLAHWLYISEHEEAEIWRRSIDMTEQHQQREQQKSSSDKGDRDDQARQAKSNEMCETSSTISERNFCSRYKSTTRKMIHRRATIEMYKRIMSNRLKREKRVEISRSNGEFGFRIHGSRPVVVSAIERGTSAETCGLQVGDLIYSINGTNILDMAHSDVVQLAHNADSASLVLDLVPTNDFLVTMNKYKPSPSNKRYEPIVTGFLMRLSPSTAQPLLIDLQAQMSSGGEQRPQSSCSQQQRAAKLVQVMRLAWRERYFVLRGDNCLYWYKSPNDVEPHGGINLQGFSATLTDEFSEPNYVIRLIRYGGQPHYLGTDNMCDIQTWVDSINRAATEANQNDPYMKQTLSLARGQANKIPEPDCCGWLYKFSHKKGGGAHWRPAYFVLKDACLYLFRDQLQQPQQQQQQAQDSILLLGSNQQASAVYYLHGYRVRSKHIENKRHTFELLPPNRKTIRPIFLMATNEIEKKRWIAALEYSIDRWIEID